MAGFGVQSTFRAIVQTARPRPFTVTPPTCSFLKTRTFRVSLAFDKSRLMAKFKKLRETCGVKVVVYASINARKCSCQIQRLRDTKPRPYVINKTLV